MTDLKPCRDKFEEWYSEYGKHPMAVLKKDNGYYVGMGAQLAWGAWQAAWNERGGEWQPASEAPYDTVCLFYTVDGKIVQGFIYDGGEKDFGYTHFIPLPSAPER